MLLRQNCRRHQIGHLLAVLYCLKGCTDRDLCLAVAHITADEAVHDLPALHVLFYGLNRRQLVIGLIKREHLLKLPLPDRILTVRKAFFPLTLRIQLYQIFCDRTHCRAHPRLCTVPLLRAEPVELRRLRRVGIRIFLDHIKLRRRHVQTAAPRILDLHVILCDLVDFYFLNSPVNTESVVFMDNKISDRKLGKA